MVIGIRPAEITINIQIIDPVAMGTSDFTRHPLGDRSTTVPSPSVVPEQKDTGQ
jgi:hypothetical protein